MQKILSNDTIVITRPIHQAGPLAGLIQNLGGKTILFPTLEILPITDNRSVLEAVARLNQYHLALFVSANAVRYALPLCPKPLPMKIIAIGPGTARALHACQVTVDWTPESHRSEGILEAQLLQNVKGKNIAIFCGENSRSLLKDALTQRGATVHEIICYRRRCPVVDSAQTIRQWQAAQVTLIISTSAESLANLWRLFAKIDSAWLLRIPLLVISPAMAAQAAAWGFQTVITATGASDQAIMASIIREKNA